MLIYSTYINQEFKLLQRQIFKFKILLKNVGQPLKFAINEQILPVHIQVLVQTLINPPAERHWWILFAALGLQRMNLGKSPHVFLLIESLPFPATLLCFCPLHPPTPPPPAPPLSFYWHAATHGWKEKLIRRAASRRPIFDSAEGKIIVMTAAWVTNVEDLDHVLTPGGHFWGTEHFLEAEQTPDQPRCFGTDIRQTVCCRQRDEWLSVTVLALLKNPKKPIMSHKSAVDNVQTVSLLLPKQGGESLWTARIKICFCGNDARHQQVH